MAGIRIRRCPFCEERVEIEKPYVFYDKGDKKYHFVHCCETGNSDSRLIVCVETKTKEDLIALWSGMFVTEEEEK